MTFSRAHIKRSWFFFASGTPNGTNYHLVRPTNPSFNHNNSNPYGYNPNRNDQYNPNGAHNSGSYGQNYDNSRGSTTYRPFTGKHPLQISKFRLSTAESYNSNAFEIGSLLSIYHVG